MNSPCVAPKSSLPTFDTHVPFIGKVDLNSPLEWVFIGAFTLDIFMVQGIAKWIIAAGIIAVRYELGKA